MEGWPGWAYLLLCPGVGAGIGLAIAGKPGFPLSPALTACAGFAVGLLAGLVLWARDRRRQAEVQPPDDEPAGPAPQSTEPPPPPSRWGGSIFLFIGLAALAANHVLVEFAGVKYFALVLGGSFFASLGLAALILGQFVPPGVTGAEVPWWVHAVLGAFLLGGLALGLYLWVAVY
jgi:hypothetical protein